MNARPHPTLAARHRGDSVLGSAIRNIAPAGAFAGIAHLHGLAFDAPMLWIALATCVILKETFRFTILDLGELVARRMGNRLGYLLHATVVQVVLVLAVFELVTLAQSA